MKAENKIEPKNEPKLWFEGIRKKKY